MKTKILIVLVFLMSFALHLQAQIKPVVIMDTINYENGIDSLTFQSATFRGIIADTSGSGWILNGKGFAFSVDSTFPNYTYPGASRIPGNTPAYYGPVPLAFSGRTTTSIQLMHSTTYYIKAFVKKGSGTTADTAWSNVASFTTPAAVTPRMYVLPATEIGLASANLHGNIDSIFDPVKQWIKKGFVYSKNSNPVHGTGTIELLTTTTGNPASNVSSANPYQLNASCSNLDTGDTYYVRAFIIVKYGASDQDTIYSEQYSFTTIHPCREAPQNVNVDTLSITLFSAKAKWIPGLGQKRWEVDCGIVGHIPGAGTFYQETTSDSIEITGLTPGITYTVYVRSKCNDTTFSEWSALNPYTYFTTLQYPCAPIEDIYVEELRTTSATIKWTPGSVSQWRWQILFAKASESFMSTGSFIYTPSFSPFGLTKNTDYKFKVRAVCDRQDDVLDTMSEWSAEFVFHTPSQDIVSLDLITSQSKIQIYPNPATDEINFDYKDVNIVKMEIINSKGQIIDTLEKNIKKYKFGKQAKGIFIIKIYTDNGLQEEKIIVE
ncbi:MAG: T9SS type A sorting domain-containing protein [Bacteroidales bacterium]|nr:T9SS type A sorting domain-containing protein [Bacteroidales bacterium]